jgi:hypothetical protein
MDVNIGSDSTHRKNKLNVTLKIEGRTATVVGTINEGTAKAEVIAPPGQTTRVKGAGTKTSPFLISFPTTQLQWH